MTAPHDPGRHRARRSGAAQRCVRLAAGLGACLALTVTAARAQEGQPRAAAAAREPGQAPAQPAPPPAFSWDVSFDTGWGMFGFANTLFDRPREGDEPDVKDRWFEGYVKPGLTLGYDFGGGGRVWGTVSAVGERTYGDLPAAFGLDVHSFEVEDLAVGWKSGTALSRWKEDALQVTFGQAPFTVGNGFLLWDGGAEGASRGGYWSNARKSWSRAAVGRFAPNAHTIEAFYLEKNELPEDESRNRVWGVNYEWAPAESTTLGAMYLRCVANPRVLPERDGLQVLNLRAFTAPWPAVPDLGFEFEYARETLRDRVGADAWTIKAAYTLSAVPWAPTVSYRYAAFEGDDPATSRNESFDPLFLGFADWGTWWQGEIAGEYFVANSNLVSHQGRLHLDPSDGLGTGLVAYWFALDRPAGGRVTSRNLAFELDWYADWAITRRLTISAVAAFLDPGEAVAQASGRTSTVAYGMLYVSYSF